MIAAEQTSTENCDLVCEGNKYRTEAAGHPKYLDLGRYLKAARAREEKKAAKRDATQV